MTLPVDLFEETLYKNQDQVQDSLEQAKQDILKAHAHTPLNELKRLHSVHNNSLAACKALETACEVWRSTKNVKDFKRKFDAQISDWRTEQGNSKDNSEEANDYYKSFWLSVHLLVISDIEKFL